MRSSRMRALAGFAASGGNQNFLGARWVAPVVRHTPARFRKNLAIRLLDLSPHYFYAEREAEVDRNRRSRSQMVDDLLAPLLQPDMRVIDYGCGPGFWASAVVPKVGAVEAVDISTGVLACAEALNAAPNIEFETPVECGRRAEPVDLVYSFAVVQHLPDATLMDVLAMLRRRLRPDGTMLLHFAMPDDDWRTEQEWNGDRSLTGRMKLRFGLNCFGRSACAMTDLLNHAGFADVRIEPLAGRTNVEDDIALQHLAIVR
jgi:SAM-dependent methyltransferase